MVARSGADCQMDGATERTKKRRPRRNSDKCEEAERADPPKVKQEERSDAGKREVPKGRAEEGVQTESKRTAAVAASQKGAVVDKAVRPGTEKQPRDADAEGDSYSDSSDHSVTPPLRSKKPLEPR